MRHVALVIVCLASAAGPALAQSVAPKAAPNDGSNPAAQPPLAPDVRPWASDPVLPDQQEPTTPVASQPQQLELPSGPADRPQRELAPIAPPERPRAYTSQITIADAVAGGLVLTGAGLGLICFAETFEVLHDQKPDHHPTCSLALVSLVLAGGTFALASPIIHIAHDRPLMALAAFGVRVVAPFGVALAAVALDAPGAGGALAAVTLGAAILLDWFVLAVPPAPKEGPAPGAVALQPTVVAFEHGAGAGLLGRF